jgi:predicted LPLAT superfamily acyltransferase
VFIVSNAARTECTFYVEEPIGVERSDDRNADILRATERCVAIYAKYVKLYPDQWFNFFDFWRAPLAGERITDDAAVKAAR